MKCPTCHEEYKRSETFHAHVPNCAYKDDPLPEPEPIDLEKPIDKMTKPELLAYAKENGVEVTEAMTKPQIIEAIAKAQEADEAAELAELQEQAKSKEIEGFETMTKEQLLEALKEEE